MYPLGLEDDSWCYTYEKDWQMEHLEKMEEIKTKPITLNVGKYSVEVSSKEIKYYVKRKKNKEIRYNINNNDSYNNDSYYIINSSLYKDIAVYGGYGNQLITTFQGKSSCPCWENTLVSLQEFQNA